MFPQAKAATLLSTVFDTIYGFPQGIGVQVKICGITNSEDARAAVDAGADAIGLIFYEGSKRCVDEHRAAEIVAQLPPYTSINALFVNPTEAAVLKVLSKVAVSQIQFHGEESAAFCEQFTVLCQKHPGGDAARMRALIADHTNARAYLLIPMCRRARWDRQNL